MEDLELRPYVGEIVRQHELAVIAGTGIDADRLTALEIHAKVQSILTASALMSRMLWADTRDTWSEERIAFATERAAALRAIVRPDSILQRRAVRNALEHLDERLDTATSEGRAGMIADTNVGSMREFSLPEGVLWLRHYDPESTVASVLGWSVSLREVVAAMESASTAARGWLRNKGFAH